MLPSWLRQLFRNKFTGHGTVAPFQNALTLEALENRAMPAIITWTGGAVPDFDFNGSGTTNVGPVDANGAPVNPNDVGESGDLSWSNPLNWDLGVPTSGDDVVFETAAFYGGTLPRSANYFKYYTTDRFVPTPNSVMDLTQTVRSITIKDAGWLIVDQVVDEPLFPQGNAPTNLGTLTVTDGITYLGAGSSTLYFRMQLSNEAQNFTATNAAGTLNIIGNIGTSPAAANPSQVGFIKLGDGTISLGGRNPVTGAAGGNNTFAGLVEVQQGVLLANSNNALGLTAVGTNVLNGATLRVNVSNFRESLTIQGTGVGGQGALFGGDGVDPLTGGTVLNGVTLNPSATVGGRLTISGVVSGSGNLTTIGTITLTTANTYGGVTFVNAGSLAISNDDALSPGSYTVVSSGATLALLSNPVSGARVIDDELLILNGTGLADTGNNNQPLGALFAQGANRTTPAEWRSAIFLEGNATIGVFDGGALLVSGHLANLPASAAATALLTPTEALSLQAYRALNRPVVANASLSKWGKGTVIFPNPNLEFSGNTFVNNGVLVMQGPNVLGPATRTTAPRGGAITVNSDITNQSFGTLELQGQYTLQKNLTLNGPGYTGGALSITDNAATPAVHTVIDVAGTVTIASTTTISNDPNTDLTISGVIGGAAGQNLTKVGTGTVSITNTNTFLGALTLRNGVTTVTRGGGFGGTGGAGTTVASGAALVLASGITVQNEALTLTSAAGSSAALQVSSGTNVWTGTVSVIGNNQIGPGDEAIINVTGATGSLEFSNVVSGDAKIRKLGAGELKLTGTASNTFVDTLQIEQGTVSLKKIAPVGTTVNAVAGAIIVGDGQGGNNADVLRLDAPNQIPDTRAITVNSSGLFDLNGSNETVGPLALQGGEVTTGAGSLILTTNVATFGSSEMSRITGNVFLGSTTRTFTFLPGAATTFSANRNPAQAGGTVTLTFTVTGNPGDPVPTGTVSFFDGNIFLGTATVLAGTATFTVQANVLTVGAHTITAVYTGDANYAPSTVPLDQSLVIVNPSERAVLTSSASPALAGQVITFTFNLPPRAGEAVPTGTVQFFDGPNPIGAPVALSALGTATYMTTLPVGSHQITAAYSGDGTYSPVQVTLANQQVGTPAQLVLRSSGNPVAPGSPVTFTFIASGDSSAPTPGGSVQFFDNGVAIGAPVALDANGVATLTTSALTVGTHTITAAYTGDANVYLPGVVPLAPTLVVGGTPLLTVISGANQAIAASAVPLTFIATGRAGDPVPTGTVQFFDNGVGIGAPVALVNGQATISPTTLGVGSRTITAVYSGDNFYAGGTGRLTANQTIIAAPTPAAGTIAGIVSSSSNSVTSNGNVTFTFTAIPPSGGVIPNGTVQFFDGTTPIGAPVALNTVGNNGVASVTTSGLTPGTHTIRAQYFGGNYTANTYTLTPAQVVVNPYIIQVSSSNNPAGVTENVTFTANFITLPGAPALTGTVSFYDNGVQIGTIQNVVGGSASVTTPNLTPGTHTITVRYFGSGGLTPTYAPTVTDVPLAPSQVVGVPPIMLLTSNLNPAPPGSLVTLTFVASGKAGDPVPAGSVQFFDNGVPIGGTVPLNAGSATRDVSFTPGTHTITAQFIPENGNTNYTSGVATLVPSQVVTTPAAIQLTADNNPTATGANVTFTYRLTPGTNDPVPTGTVQFFDGATPISGQVILVNGVATLTTNTLTIGTHTITAVFTSGDSNYQSNQATFNNLVVSNPPLPPLAPPPTIVGAAQPTLQMNAVMSGAAGAGVIKTGSGQLVLNAVNTYTGTTTVNGLNGAIVVGVNNALPDTGVVVTTGTLTVNPGVSDQVASLTGAGTLDLGAGGNLATGVSNGNDTFAGPITGSGTLTKVGAGTLTLTGNSPAYTGSSVVAGGTLLVTANQSSASVVVQGGATLGGTGTVGAVTVNPGGVLAPGTSPGILNSTGNLTFSAGSTFLVEVNGTTVGTQYDRYVTTGTANLNGATLGFNLGFTPTLGDSFTILTAAGGVSGAFNGLPDQGTFTLNNRVYQVSYLATSVVVTQVANATTTSLVSNNNPSLPGSAVTFTFTITPTAGADPMPLGTVQFQDNGVNIGAPVTLTAGSGNSAVAVLTTSALVNGSHTITAVYTPQTVPTASPYLTATAAIVQAVTVPSTTTLTALQGPVVFGSVTSFLAGVGEQSGLQTPTGTFTFTNSATGAVLGVVALDATGRAVFSTAALPPGTATVTVTYSGDSFYRASTATVTQVVDRQNRVVVGSDAGPVATVQVFDSTTGALVGTFQPFDQYTGGVKVATGDVNNDGVADIVVSAGAGAPGGHVKVYDGVSFGLLSSFFTFLGYNGGVNVAVGDVDGDGFGDVVIGTAASNDHVKAFSGRSLLNGGIAANGTADPSTILSFFAYGGGNPVGVTVAAGDVDGDGRADVITGSATFAGHVKAFSASGQQIGSYFAYGAGYLGGIYVAAGDLDGDGRAEIVTGATNAPHVKALRLDGSEVASFFAYTNGNGSPAPFGVRVAVADRNGDRLADILTGSAGGAPHVKAFSGLDPSLLLDSFIAIPPGQAPSTSGVFVGGSAPK
ncbi:Extracellular serine protease precursor [Gemmata obscuriglobus]|uniref:Bacterial Ig-like domain-containing protein n=1 Tax=Gemmata obscuriglobus TaxID=114 RepID=A0A2Z3HAD4_9BACT|nr:Ig-like domain repeat protein [Gemmata obscuriglobus]AWM41402.1 hypothetical protein C1280_33305 [Gemmata obscuriglobus]QEG32701.1 Extracellular serine protease precursor [Gemmata obscuriglobus]VTS12059.1 Uncharacterized protein OS=uncultured bacterium GN=ACD_81C00179G0003 PE=4 SV=1: Autotrns_rpt: Autotrns_rpt: Autotrns_rpt: Autotrns_rpt: Autotrns_rpt: Autotrns_rpt [Gemmata obscuriglobus UQM 2246]